LYIFFISSHFFSSTVLILTSPLLVPVMILVWFQDWHSPFYIAPRVGINGSIFRMVKLRSMIVGADKSGVDSTSGSDARITPIGNFIRRYKLDELTQMWNVLKGDMSVVGPRPNVKRETDLYSTEEKQLLTMRPGITDFASIIFADEGDILKDEADPDLAYNQLIRPWKSRLGITYVQRHSFGLDVKLVFLTALTIVSRKAALTRVTEILIRLKTDPRVIEVSRRERPLIPSVPPGMTSVVTSRAVATRG